MTSPTQRDLVVAGGSAGGVEALKRFVTALPADLPATVCVTLHLASGSTSLLPSILARRAAVRVRAAEDGAPLEHGVVYVSQPDSHLVVVDDHVMLGTGARENGNRPSLDVLMRSAAVARGPRVVGAVLTGMLDDGSAGLARVARYGGVALVQDPAEAEFPPMPRNALASTPLARALPLDALVQEVVRLVSENRGAGPDVSGPERERDEAEVRGALGPSALPDRNTIGLPTPYSCPDCGGVLNSVDELGLLRLRCRVGHAFSADTLMHSQGDTIADALWTALRALDERRETAERLSNQADGTGRAWSRAHFRLRAEQARRSANVLREMLAERADAPRPGEEPGQVATGP